jgi:Domain of unknown function (DUF4424)
MDLESRKIVDASIASRRAVRRVGLILTALCGALLSGPATANDSASELAAGGIVLVKNDVIVMQREDLHLSPAEVRVRYEMRNDSGTPVTLRVAFPLPELPAMTPGGRTTTTGGHNIMMNEPRGPNFIGFRVWADGREITPEVEIRAVLPDGRDIAAALQQIGGLPLVLRPGVFIPPDDPDLDAETRRRLAEIGAIEASTTDRVYRLPWATYVTFHWMQTFAPGVTVVEHSYRPVLGFGYVSVDQRGVSISGLTEDGASAYCIDSAGTRTLRELSEQARARREKAGDPNNALLLANTLGYVLKTAQNWRGPIGGFHLSVKGDPNPAERWTDSRQPRAVYFCSPVPLKETAPLLMEGEAHDFVPTRDLQILFVAE